MRQCILISGNSVMTSWLDLDISDLNRFVTLKDDIKSRLWEITSIGKHCFSKQWISARTKDYENMRKMTDV